jgi:hypothetical protein
MIAAIETFTVTVPRYSSDSLARCGWRYKRLVLEGGVAVDVQVPLTPQEFLHPREGYHLPNSTFHDRTIADLQDMLIRRYATNPSVAVFQDLLIKWDIKWKQ